MNPHDPTTPDPENAAWEEAMSRDFDARVRDLHEAPLNFDSVKGKAHKIRRNRRAAVAGGILGVAAIVTPIAVLANDNGSPQSKEPEFAPEVPSETTSAPMNSDVDTDYIVDGVWHQADGGEIPLPDNATPYDAAVVWNDQLVATRWDGEVFSIADVIDTDGKVVDSFDTTGPVVVNDAGTTIAWVDSDGTVMTAWEGDEVDLGTVDLSAPGEAVAWFATAITGGPNCYEEVDGCLVFLNSGLGKEPTTRSSHGIDDNPVPGSLNYRDASTVGGFPVTYVDTQNDDASVCTGLYDLETNKARWTTCDYDARDISPSGAYVVGAPAYGDGLGYPDISILDAETGKPTGQYATEGGFISTDVAWSDENTLLFSAYDGAKWHLISLAPDGSFTELVDPINGDEFSPYVLIPR